MVHNNNAYEDGYFLVGDTVRTPEGYEAEVIGVKGKSVDVYISEKTSLGTYNESKLDLLTAIPNPSSELQASFQGKDWTKAAYTSHYCGHWMDEFKLNDPDESTVYLSARGTSSKDKNKEIPTYGCYMDQGWQSTNSIWLTPNAPDDNDNNLFDIEDIPSMYVKWTDMGALPLKEYSQVIVWCMSRIMEEGAKLEIGCYGAHGRTGTLLAGLLVYNGMDGHEAIKEVQKTYCGRAIESQSQEDLIIEYAKALRMNSNG